MFKYTFFFVIRCFASDTVPEVARCSGPKSGTERILTAVRRPFRRILRAGIFRGARSRFVRFVGSCARPKLFCFPRRACSGCRRKRGRSLSLGCLVFVRSPSPRPPGCPRARSGPHVCRSVCSRRSGLLPGRDSDTVARRFFCFDNFDLFCTDLAVFWDPARGIQFAIP